MFLIINESGSVYDDQGKVNGREYMNPETGEMLGTDEINNHKVSEYLQRCSLNYTDENQKNRHLNLEDMNP